jgi:hypothetical protein
MKRDPLYVQKPKQVKSCHSPARGCNRICNSEPQSHRDHGENRLCISRRCLPRWYGSSSALTETQRRQGAKTQRSSQECGSSFDMRSRLLLMGCLRQTSVRDGRGKAPDNAASWRFPVCAFPRPSRTEVAARSAAPMRRRRERRCDLPHWLCVLASSRFTFFPLFDGGCGRRRILCVSVSLWFKKPYR